MNKAELKSQYELGERHFCELDFRNLNLSYFQLAGADFCNSNFSHANLKAAGLSGVNFAHCDLTFADLSGADLTNSNLRGANLKGANLQGAKIKNIQYDAQTLFPIGFRLLDSQALEAEVVEAEILEVGLTEHPVDVIEIPNAPPISPSDHAPHNPQPSSQNSYQPPTHSKDWELIVVLYSKNPWKLEICAVVSATLANLSLSGRNSVSQGVTLKSSPNPNYWVVIADDPNMGYWLVPKAGFKANGATFDALQALFNIQGQQSQRLKLLKPASVRRVSTQDWELLNKGDVQFL